MSDDQRKALIEIGDQMKWRDHALPELLAVSRLKRPAFSDDDDFIAQLKDEEISLSDDGILFTMAEDDLIKLGEHQKFLPKELASRWRRDRGVALREIHRQWERAEAAAAEITRLRDALRPILDYPGIREHIGNILYDSARAALDG